MTELDLSRHAPAKPPAPAPKPAIGAPFGPKFILHDVNFYYGEKHALKDIDLTIRDKNVTALIGPSGCGKSTLLRVLNRIYELYPNQAATGEVLLDNEDIFAPAIDINSLRRRIGMVFQKPTPFPTSIFENIAYGIRLYEPLSRARMAERVEMALRHAALWDEVKDVLHRSGLSLSGGQQQRLCIARTIAVNPEVILFDEPCSALDPASSLHIEALLDTLKRDFCVVIVTHNLHQAARISNDAAFMYLGQIIEFGPTETIFTHPSQRQTEQYVTGRFG